jgi:3-hydroxybutyryl-CoA dehydratase
MPVVKTYAELKVGDKASLKKTITPAVVKMFADVSDDQNPLHQDEAYAKTTMFGRCIAHGMISAGLMSAVAGTKLPGEAVYMSHTMQFKRPVYINDTVTAWMEITEKVNDAKKIFKARAWVENQDGKVVVDGEATFMAAK